MLILKMLPITFCLLIASFVGVVSQPIVREPILPSKTIHIHLVDLTRVFSPGLKMSLEVLPNQDFSLNYEASIISDLNGKHFMNYFNYSKIKFVNGFSLGFYPMVRVNRNDFAGFRINYSLKYREINDWIPRDGGTYLQKLDYWHLTNSLGYYYRYMIRPFLENDFQLTMAINAGYLGLYVVNDLPEDVISTRSTLEQSFSYAKSGGFHFLPHVYLEINISFPSISEKP